METEPVTNVIIRDPDEDLQSVASLPESEPSDDSDESDIDEGESDVEREWKENVKQLELIMSMVLIPYLGKYFGRKSAYWIFAKFMAWKYPVEVVITNPGLFRSAGIVGAATL